MYQIPPNELERAKREGWPPYTKQMAEYTNPAIRWFVYCRAKGMCEGKCGKKGTQSHHLNYKRIGNEHPDDLIWTCENCHLKEHPERLNELEERKQIQETSSYLFSSLMRRNLENKFFNIITYIEKRLYDTGMTREELEELLIKLDKASKEEQYEYEIHNLELAGGSVRVLEIWYRYPQAMIIDVFKMLFEKFPELNNHYVGPGIYPKYPEGWERIYCNNS